MVKTADVPALVCAAVTLERRPLESQCEADSQLRRLLRADFRHV